MAISVVIAHSEALLGLKFVGGQVAVEIFFIISGFYMTMVLNTKYIGKGSYKLFISNRILRLFPSYLTVILITIIASIVSYFMFNSWMKLSPWIENINILDIKTYIILALTNLLILGQDIVMFTGIDKSNGTLYFINNFQNADIKTYSFLLIPQAWSIGLELLFYIVAPFIVRRNIKSIILFIFLSILLRIFIYFYIGWFHDPWTYRFFPTELALFLFGSIAFKIYQLISHTKLNNNYMIFLLVIYFALIILYQFIPEMNHLKNWFIYIISIGIIPILFLLTKNNKVDNFIGELSYPVYIIQFISIGVVNKFIPEEYRGELAIIISIIASIFLVKFIEEPINRIRQKRVKLSK